MARNEATDSRHGIQVQYLWHVQKYSQAKEPLKSHELPERPWQRIAFDLFELDKQGYVVMVDYYSKFFEVTHLSNSKSKTVIKHIKPQFARYGIPEIIVSDNGPEFSGHEFAEFAKQYGFKQITSSPRYPSWSCRTICGFVKHQLSFNN